MTRDVRMPVVRPRAALRARLELWLWRYGHWPLLAAALVASSAALWWVELRAVRGELQAVDSALLAVERTPQPPIRVVNSDSDAQRWTSFRSVLTPFSESTDMVRRLLSLTQEELRWTQAEFSQLHDSPLGLVRLQISVPVSGTYPRLQSAIERALVAMPNLSIDQILFKRQQVGQEQLEARIRMSLWLQSSPTTPRVVDGIAVAKGSQ